MIKGQEVTEWFAKHPEMVSRLEGINFQLKYPRELAENETEEALYRPLEISDIEYIAFKSFFDNSAGIFIWYYPQDVPHCCKNCCKIGEIEELEH